MNVGSSLQKHRQRHQQLEMSNGGGLVEVGGFGNGLNRTTSCGGSIYMHFTFKKSLKFIVFSPLEIHFSRMKRIHSGPSQHVEEL